MDSNEVHLDDEDKPAAATAVAGNDDKLSDEQGQGAAAVGQGAAAVGQGEAAVGAVMRLYPYNDDELSDEQGQGAVMRVYPQPSPSRLQLIKRLKRRGAFARQIDMTPEMMRKLLARNELTRKISLGLSKGVVNRKERLKIEDSIGKRVDAKKVQEVVLLPISVTELRDYIRICREKMDLGQPLATPLPQFPPVSPFAFGKRKCQLQQQLLDDLKITLSEKIADIFKLKRIQFAIGNSFQQTQWKLQPGDFRTINEEKEIAKNFSEEELPMLHQQCQELRRRIDELEEEIIMKASCTVSGGKTKSKHTKSKHTKSKHTKSKHTKSKKSKRRK